MSNKTKIKIEFGPKAKDKMFCHKGGKGLKSSEWADFMKSIPFLVNKSKDFDFVKVQIESAEITIYKDGFTVRQNDVVVNSKDGSVL